MIILLLLLDILIYRFTAFHTYFIALAPVICTKENAWKLIAIGLIMDYFSFHMFPLETIILFFIFLIIQYLKKKLFHPTWSYFICIIISFFLFLCSHALRYGKVFLLFRPKELIFAMILQLSLSIFCDRKGVSHIKWIR